VFYAQDFSSSTVTRLYQLPQEAPEPSPSMNSAFETFTKAFKTLRGFVDKEGLKSYGLPITVFTSTDDKGFQFEAALPLAEPPKSAPRDDIAVGTSPQGHALKFVHRGSYGGLDNTYEAITNFLADKRLEAKDMFIEQYVTDPVSTNEESLVVNVFVMIKWPWIVGPSVGRESTTTLATIATPQQPQSAETLGGNSGNA
jgi:effector-binding domain-containing protein